MINELIEEGSYDNTILVIGSDHGQRFTTNKKIPLIIHFSNNEFSGVVFSNVQNIDIAPTILDYLHIHRPPWMSGESLLSIN